MASAAAVTSTSTSIASAAAIASTSIASAAASSSIASTSIAAIASTSIASASIASVSGCTSNRNKQISPEIISSAAIKNAKEMLIAFKYDHSHESMLKLLRMKVLGVPIPFDRSMLANIYAKPPWEIIKDGQEPTIPETFEYLFFSKREKHLDTKTQRRIGGSDGVMYWKSHKSSKLIIDAITGDDLGYVAQFSLKFVDDKTEIDSNWSMTEYVEAKAKGDRDQSLCKIRMVSKGLTEKRNDVKALFNQRAAAFLKRNLERQRISAKHRALTADRLALAKTVEEVDVVQGKLDEAQKVVDNLISQMRAEWEIGFKRVLEEKQQSGATAVATGGYLSFANDLADRTCVVYGGLAETTAGNLVDIGITLDMVYPVEDVPAASIDVGATFDGGRVAAPDDDDDVQVVVGDDVQVAVGDDRFGAGVLNVDIDA